MWGPSGLQEPAAAVCGGRGLQPSEHPAQPGREEDHDPGGGAAGVPRLPALVRAAGVEGVAEGTRAGRLHQALAGGGGAGSSYTGSHGEGQAGCELRGAGESHQVVGTEACCRAVPA